ncbi:MAG: hypothetical protein F6K45_01450 [Kamptonema sp. SIO1D9]|nr:hypothetical protein [Kamptonema sp. SIO1D9]
MSHSIKLSSEDITQYREQFSQQNQKEALYALDVIEAVGGDVTIAANKLASKYGIEVHKSVNILEELAKKLRNSICDEEFIDKVIAGAINVAVGSLCATGQIPEALAAPLVIYLAKKGIQKWCKSNNET